MLIGHGYGTCDDWNFSASLLMVHMSNITQVDFYSSGLYAYETRRNFKKKKVNSLICLLFCNYSFLYISPLYFNWFVLFFSESIN